MEAAVSVADSLLASRVTAADQERIADDYLADLGGRRNRTGTQESAPPAGADSLS